MGSVSKFVSVLLLSWCVMASGLSAQPAEGEIPPSLREWSGWVLADVPSYQCSFVAGERHCDWPGRLSLVLNEDGGSFVFDVVSERRVRWTIPGGQGAWPQEVLVDGKSSVVIADASGRPSVMLSPGSHQIRGAFSWRRLALHFDIPPDVALVSVTLRGKENAAFRREEKGRLLFDATSNEASQHDELFLQVHRRIVDGMPLQVESRMNLKVTGKAREIELGHFEVQSAKAIQIDADVPVRVDANGILWAQVSSGDHQITWKSRILNLEGPISMPKKTAASPWPVHEIWSFVESLRFRQVEASGANRVEASRTTLPSEWQGDAAYRVMSDDKISFKSVRRGVSKERGNLLTLQREIWPDISGSGATVRDSISGDFHRDWRIDLGVSNLGRISLDGDDQLVTKNAKGSGTEVRSEKVNLEADWRLEKMGRTIPANGWSLPMQSVVTSLHLPPGYSLLWASGPDEISGDWIHQWSLWSIFFVILTIALAYRGMGRLSAVLLAVFLVLSYFQDGAPLVFWVPIALVLLAHHFITFDKIQYFLRIAFYVFACLLVLSSIPFIVGESRFVQHPFRADVHDSSWFSFLVTDDQTKSLENVQAVQGLSDEMGAAISSTEMAPNKGDYRQERKKSGLQKLSSLSRSVYQDNNVVVQTGPGIPKWSPTESATFSWSGALAPEESVEISLLSPTINRIISVIRLGLLFAIFFLLWRMRPRAGGNTKSSANTPKVAAATLSLMAVMCINAPVEAQQSDGLVGQPSQELLQQLKGKLTTPPACGERCVDIASMKIDANATSVTFEIDVHAATPSGFPLPGPAKKWVPTEVLVDGKTSHALRLASDGHLWLRVDQGVHQVKLRGPLAPNDVASFAFLREPRLLSISAKDRDVVGQREDGSLSGLLELRPQVRAAVLDEKASVQLGNWFSIHRHFVLGAEWSVETSVTREGSTDASAAFELSALPGEQVTEASVETKDGRVRMSFAPGERTVSWTSRLEIKSPLSVVAPKTMGQSEKWEVECSVLWHCEFAGIRPTNEIRSARYFPTFDPWAGEKLTMTVTRPAATEGASVTIDRANLEISPGARWDKYKLSVTYRASQPGPRSVSLPAGITEVRAGDSSGDIPFQLDTSKGNSSIRFSTSSGSKDIWLSWQSQSNGVSGVYHPPKISFDSEVVNARVEFVAPSEQWLLWVSGDGLGPHIYFWGYLGLLLLMGFVLRRAAIGEMKLHDWTLLLLGLSQIELWAALLVVAWFVVVHVLRDRHFDGFKEDLRFFLIPGLTAIAGIVLLVAVNIGLLASPDMILEGSLNWYVDRSGMSMPSITVVSVSVWVWRLAMLAWSLWLAMRIVRWGRWGVRTWLGPNPSEFLKARSEAKKAAKEKAKEERLARRRKLQSERMQASAKRASVKRGVDSTDDSPVPAAEERKKDEGDGS